MIAPCMSTYPTLKPGVNYLIEHKVNRSEIYVGTATNGIKLSSHAAILFIEKCNGSNELQEIISEIGISGGQAIEILQPLLTHNLISLYPNPVPQSEIEDLATQISAARIKPELNTIAWRGTELGVTEVLNRANFPINILGSNRLAFALLELFLATGYLSCKLMNESKGEVAPALVGATPFRVGDIGQPLLKIEERIARDYALNVALLRKSKGLNKPNCVDGSYEIRSVLTIKTSDFLPDQITDLMLDGRPHLQIGNLNSGKIEFGPLVIPGKTPCYNCISLWKNERFAKFAISQKLKAPLEISAAGVTYLTGLIVSLVDNYFALGKSFLFGSSILVNLLKPLEYTERFWQPNPRCGCLELL